MATINKNTDNAANKYRPLWICRGMTKRLLILSKIQFSIFRFANSHIPAQAVELTHASQYGTSESVKLNNKKLRIKKPNIEIARIILHSLRSQVDIG